MIVVYLRHLHVCSVFAAVWWACTGFINHQAWRLLHQHWHTAVSRSLGLRGWGGRKSWRIRGECSKERLQTRSHPHSLSAAVVEGLPACANANLTERKFFFSVLFLNFWFWKWAFFLSTCTCTHIYTNISIFLGRWWLCGKRLIIAAFISRKTQSFASFPLNQQDGEVQIIRKRKRKEGIILEEKKPRKNRVPKQGWGDRNLTRYDHSPTCCSCQIYS